LDLHHPSHIALAAHMTAQEQFAAKKRLDVELIVTGIAPPPVFLLAGWPRIRIAGML